MMTIGIEHDAEVERALAWLYEIAGRELLERLNGAKERFKHKCTPPAGSILWPDPVELLPPSDPVSGIILQAHALIHDRRYFDARLGSRYIPFFKLIGSQLPALRNIDGAVNRAKKLVEKKNDHPEGTLLELAVAARYIQEGYDLRFIAESDKKSPDLELLLNDLTIQIECKRLRASRYEQDEIVKVRSMFGLVSALVAEKLTGVYVDVTFLEPLQSVPDDYLRLRVERALDASPIHHAWSDDFGRGTVTHGDMKALHSDTADSCILVGPKLFRLFTRQVVPSQRVLMGVGGDGHEEDPRYVDNITAVALLSWDVESPASTLARARHVRSKLAEIDAQLESCDLGAAHIVLDAERDSRASDLRRDRNQDEVKSFRFNSKLIHLYSHYLLPHTAESTSWTIDETADPASRVSESLLVDPRLFVEGIELGDAPAWHQPPPR